MVWGSANIQNFLVDLERFGFFQFVLPFLVVFALIYGILSNIKIFKENKGVVAILSLSIGLLALWQGFVPAFFAEIFPRLGIGLSVLIAALILIGAFVPMDKFGKEGWGNYIFMGLGALIFLIVFFSSSSAYGFLHGTSWISNNLSLIIVLLIVIGAVVVVMVGRRREKPL